MILKHKIILALVFFSLPLNAMDEAQKQEFMKNGQKYAQMLNLNSSQAKLEFMRNGGKVKEVVKTTVYLDSKPIVCTSVSNSNENPKEAVKEQDSPVSEEENAASDHQTNINIEPKLIKKNSSEKLSLLPVHNFTPEKTIKINLTTINNGQGNIIINLYGSSVTYTKGTNYNDDKISEKHD